MKITTRSNLFGATINGEHVETYVTAVMVEYESGQRYLLRDSDIPHINDRTGERYTAEQVEKRISVLVNRIKAHIAAGGHLNMNNWYEIEPRYGAPAWQGWAKKAMQDYHN